MFGPGKLCSTLLLLVFGLAFFMMYCHHSLLLALGSCVAAAANSNPPSSGPLARTRNGTCKFAEFLCWCIADC